jgi:hypothetical protein
MQFPSMEPSNDGSTITDIYQMNDAINTNDQYQPVSRLLKLNHKVMPN